jgi:hypothetical protein
VDKDEQGRLPEDEEKFYLDYFQKIEALFAALRGRSLLLSPADYQLAKGWFDRGLPLSCVLRGIREAYFKKLSESEGGEDEEVRSLSWCRWAVQKEWKEYRSVPVGSEETELSPPEKTGDEVAAILESLSYDLGRAGRAAEKRGLKELSCEIAAVDRGLAVLTGEWKGGGLQAEGLESRLQDLDGRLLEASARLLDQATLGKIEAAVERKLRRHKAVMEKEVLETTRRKAIQARLRQELVLPVLTLYTI